MPSLTGAEIIIELLERQGVRHIAGIPGGANLPLYDAMRRSSVIKHVLARHEQAAGFIAQGIARTTGEAAVCLASSGPGATNLLTAVADAKLDSIPLIAVTGQVPQKLLGTDAFQEVDTYGLSIPITKHNFLATSARELLEIIPRAFSIATAGRPGPVLIDVPKDVQNERVHVATWPAPGMRPEARRIVGPQYETAARVIEEARRPILYLGGGVVHSRAADVAVRLAEKAALPTVMTLMGLGTMPSDHPLKLEMLGMHGAPYANRLMDECDLLIAVGARFDDRATGDLTEFCPDARVIHIDIDAAEIDKLRQAHIGIRGDIRPALEALTEELRPCLRPDWLARAAVLKSLFPLRVPRIECPRSHYGLIAAVAREAGRSAVVTTDVGQHQMWVAQSYPLHSPRQLLTSGGLGTMGFGLPAAIGAALAAPERTVVCFSGDGSLLMNVQELATLAEWQPNVKIILMNNGALGLVHQQQSLFYGGRIFASRFTRQPDFCALAAAFGIDAVDLDAATDPNASLRRVFQRRGPCLIHASIGIEEMVMPMVPPGAANREMIEV